MTFLHSDYSRLLCGSAVLCLHPSAVISEDRVLFLQVNRQGNKRMQVFLHLPENWVRRHPPSFHVGVKGHFSVRLQNVCSRDLQCFPS